MSDESYIGFYERMTEGIYKRKDVTHQVLEVIYKLGDIIEPTTQKPVRIPIQFLLICIFFLLYDIELVFLFPLTSVTTFSGLYDFNLLLFFFTLLFISLVIDYNRHALM